MLSLKSISYGSPRSLTLLKTTYKASLLKPRYNTSYLFYSTSTPESEKQNLHLRSKSFDAPPKPHWFYATEIPILKPSIKNWKPTSAPEKFTPFSDFDSQRLEKAYQQFIDKEETADHSIKEIASNDTPKISVLDDRLFEVDIVKRTLTPIYWEGPVFEVRRGTWFITDGSDQQPCPESLAKEIERLYNEKLEKASHLPPEKKDDGFAALSLLNDDKNESADDYVPLSTLIDTENIVKSTSTSYYPKDSETYKKLVEKQSTPPYITISVSQQTAWILSGNFGSVLVRKLVSFGGIKVSRGYEASQSTEKGPSAPGEKASTTQSSKHRSPSPEKSAAELSDSTESADPSLYSIPDRQVDHLVICIHGIGQRLSQRLEQVNFVQDINIFRTLLKQVYLDSPALQKKCAKYLVEKYQSLDFNRPISIKQKEERQLHGSKPNILSKLSKAKMLESLERAKYIIKNARKEEEEAKEIINESSQFLQTEGSIPNAKESNSKQNKAADHRVQVIPLIWRHNIKFGMTRDDIIEQEALKKKQKKKNGETEDDAKKLGPEHGVSLEDINVDGILPLRSIVGDVVLDVLLYYQPQYHAKIFESVTTQLNKIYHEFCRRNPSFASNPQVSIIGHSLGSAIAFDILCAQDKAQKKKQQEQQQKNNSNEQEEDDESVPQLDFDVDIFFGIGSPVGMFQLLKGNHIISASKLKEKIESKNLERKEIKAPSKSWASSLFSLYSSAPSDVTEDSKIVGYMAPQVKDYYNIFHPSDPVAYRVDPLVHRDAASLPAKIVPYTQGSLPSQIQEFSQLASKFSSDATNMLSNVASTVWGFPESIANKGALASPFFKLMTKSANETEKKKNNDNQQQNDFSTNNDINKQHSSLYSLSHDKEKRSDEETKASNEELKSNVRVAFDKLPKETQQQVKEMLTAINHTGQIDYQLQEGVLDISIFAAIASHISYFENRDLASFVLSSIYELEHENKTENVK